MTYEERFYRDWVGGEGLVTFAVRIAETDLQIRAERDLTAEAEALARTVRREIEDYAAREPRFLTSLSPLPAESPCPPIVRAMLDAGEAYDVGPMAAVAGAGAEQVGRGLLEHSARVIVENGGDIWMKLPRPALTGLYCGPRSPFADRLRIRVDGEGEPVGVCTSSATVGHSLSLGRADAVVCVAASAALADAAATSLCNRVRSPDDLRGIVEAERKRGLLRGMIAVMGEHMGAFGAIEFEAA